MKITLIEAIRFRSQEYAVGAILDLSDIDARQMIASGHAAEVPPPAPAKPSKSTATAQE
jgi:hypothetical protein